MEEEFKQSFIDSIIAQRGLDAQSDLSKALNALIKEDVSDDVFVAKVMNEISLYDNKYLFTNNQITFGGQKGTTRQVVINAMNAASATIPERLPLNMYGAQVTFSDVINTLPEGTRKSVLKGLDIAAGLLTPSDPGQSKAYYEYLQDKVDDFTNETDLLAVLVRPPGGKGATLHASTDLDKWIKENGGPLQASFYEGKSFLNRYRKFPGLGQPTVLYRPIMSKEEGKDMYEFTGDYFDYVENVNPENGNLLIANEQSEFSRIAIFTQTPEGTNVEKVTYSQNEMEALNEKIADNPFVDYIDLSGDETVDNQAINERLNLFEQTGPLGELTAFGGITPDYTIFQRPDLAEYLSEDGVLPSDMQNLQPRGISAGEIDPSFFYGGMDHISGVGPTFNGTQKIPWISLSPQEKKSIQTDLLQAGYLSPDAFFLEAGDWGDNTQTAMFNAMSDANLEFKDIGTYLGDEKERYRNKPPLQQSYYVEPSPQFVKSQIDAALKSAGIKRKLSEAEMMALSEYYIQSDLDQEQADAEYARNVDMAKRMFPEAPTRIQAPATAAQLLQERVQAQFEPELTSLAQEEKERNDLSSLFSSLNTFENMIGG